MSTEDSKRKREEDPVVAAVDDSTAPDETSNDTKKLKSDVDSHVDSHGYGASSIAPSSSISNSSPDDQFEQVSGSGAAAKLSGRGTGSMEDPFIILIAPDKVRYVIGSKGAVILDMQKSSGAKIRVNQNFPEGQDREVCISGTAEQVDKAVELVSKVVAHGPTSIHPHSGGVQVDRIVNCPQAIVGKVIGHNGEIIKDIQHRSGARVQVHQQGLADGQPRQIQISGSEKAVDVAYGFVDMIMNGGQLPQAGGGMYQSNMRQGQGQQGGGGYGSMPAYGGQPYGAMMPMGGYGTPVANSNVKVEEIGPGIIKLAMDISKRDVGRVLGRKGENVKKMAVGCKIQIFEDCMPCRVEISGPQSNVYNAQRMVQEIVNNPDPNALVSLNHMPNGGGYGANAASGSGMNPYMQQMMMQQMMMQQQAYGQQQQQQQQQQPYGMRPGAAASYSNTSHQAGYPASIMPQQQAPAERPQSIWTEYKDDNGTSYWHNKITNATQWERPQGL